MVKKEAALLLSGWTLLFLFWINRVGSRATCRDARR